MDDSNCMLIQNTLVHRRCQDPTGIRQSSPCPGRAPRIDTGWQVKGDVVTKDSPVTHAATLADQLKSRTAETSLAQRQVFQADVRLATFTPRAELDMLFVLVSKPSATIEHVWPMPSEDYQDLALPVSNRVLRIRASFKDGTADKCRRTT